MVSSKKKPAPEWAQAKAFIAEFCERSRAQTETNNGSYGSRCAFPRLCVGFSGGLDSTVLLHWLAGLQAELGFTLSAVHVHHGLSSNAGHWAAHSQQVASALDIECTVVQVNVARDNGLGLEGSARQQRYQVYAQQDCEAIVLAHHLNDQAETLLLNLLRGAGPAGLAAMPRERAVQASQNAETTTALLRPFLGISRAELENYAQAQQLRWINDESNADPSFKRNHIRQALIPTIEGITPQALTLLARSAIHQAQAHELQQEIAQQDLAHCLDENAAPLGALNLAQWQTLSTVRQHNALRRWLARAGMVLELRAFNELLRTALQAEADTHPALVWRGAAVRRYRGQLYLCSARDHAGPALQFDHPPQAGERIDLPGWQGALSWQAAQGAGLKPALLTQGWAVRGRHGGEMLKLGPQRPTRSLKAHCQTLGIAPWLRETTPLITIADELVAMPGVGCAAAWQVAADEIGLLPIWQPYPAHVSA
ncbi:tRNA lysidine(34) synthetase TilS [Chitinibacter sp. ZOR0017]|uniref:tRNA lysidine(34) synthetase TilS n=1 Tax=Chitinibacter sp. ZOR0017 TaxID=1339254 RepID=UPI00068AC4B2|nr:tRNA lysidine(34) synthetase TilS [Chitinibacter sp. ZOR0017]